MPFYLTQSASSRVSKKRAPPKLSRASSLPFASSKSAVSLRRAQTAVAALSTVSDDEDDASTELKKGKVISTLPQKGAKDVLSIIELVTSSMFDPLPERAGMNSVRIAEVLNFRKDLPRVVTMAHLYATSPAATKLERNVQALFSSKKLRKLKLAGRGNDISGLGEVLITTRYYTHALSQSQVSLHAQQSFLSALEKYPKSSSVPSSELDHTHVGELTRTGFLVNQSLFGTTSTRVSSYHDNHKSIVSIPSVSRSASGSIAAVGGEAAFERLGGLNNIGNSQGTSSAKPSTSSKEYMLSVPNLAAYLQLLEAGRTHYLELLRSFSRHKQAPMYLLEERWNGNVDNETSTSMAKQARGQFSNVTPARTKKWKALYGMNFQWITAECLGAGLIEVFESGSVGLGVRALV